MDILLFLPNTKIQGCAGDATVAFRLERGEAAVEAKARI
jgi:hypothetical protein